MLIIQYQETVILTAELSQISFHQKHRFFFACSIELYRVYLVVLIDYGEIIH